MSGDISEVYPLFQFFTILYFVYEFPVAFAVIILITILIANHFFAPILVIFTSNQFCKFCSKFLSLSMQISVNHERHCFVLLIYAKKNSLLCLAIAGKLQPSKPKLNTYDCRYLNVAILSDSKLFNELEKQRGIWLFDNKFFIYLFIYLFFLLNKM